MRYCTHRRAARAVGSRAGLHEVETDELHVGAEAYADFDELLFAFPTGLAPSGAYFVSLDDERREALKAAVLLSPARLAGRPVLAERPRLVRQRGRV